LDYAFKRLNLHKVTAGVVAIHDASIKAFQKAGFEIEGVRKKHCFFNGKYVDAILLGQINPVERDNGKDIG